MRQPLQARGYSNLYNLDRVIHEERRPLACGPQEAELPSVALAACEQIVADAGHSFTGIELAYYLWLAGKEQSARQFARHHTKDTVFY